ncbi:MAG: DinB family protein [Phycisphaerales bacterium]
MDKLRVYGWLERSRARVLDGVRTLDETCWTRPFDIGAGSLEAVLKHCLIAEWYYDHRMREAPVPLYETWEVRDDTPLTFAELEAKWAAQSESTKRTIASVPDWDKAIDYQVRDDDGRDLIVSCTPDGLFTQLITHEPYHRAQVVNMLRHMGVTCGDLDFNAMEFPRRVVAG